MKSLVYDDGDEIVEDSSESDESGDAESGDEQEDMGGKPASSGSAEKEVGAVRDGLSSGSDGSPGAKKAKLGSTVRFHVSILISKMLAITIGNREACSW